MKFDFSEEEITSMYSVYEEALNAVHARTGKVAQELIARATQLKYEPVVKITSDAVTFYNEGIKAAEKRALEDWKQGDLSFTNLIKEMGAGDAAKARSQTLEADIESLIGAWETIDTSSVTGIDTSNWKCEESDFEDLAEMIKNYVDGIDGLRDEYSKSIANKKNDNGIYISIEPIVLQSISIVSAGFNEGVKKSFGELAQMFSDHANKVANAGSAYSDNIASKASGYVSSGISKLNSSVKAIWN